MFFELGMNDFKRVLPLYLREQTIFPLILAVVQQQQRGWVFVDDPDHSTCALVINNFGFMQFIGTGNFDDISEFFKSPKAFLPSYLLWYSPPLHIQKKMGGFAYEQVRCRERARFIFKRQTILNPLACPAGFTVQNLDKEWIKKTQNFKLDIGSRFWSSTDDFLNHGVGTCIIKDGKIASLCYSACIVDNLAEIDVVTQEEYRGMGLAIIATQNFITECVRRGITPTWDCFINNRASMKVAVKLGFEEERTYPFYSFNTPLTLPANVKEDHQQ